MHGGYNGVYTCEKLCARSSGMLFICVVIGLECRLGVAAQVSVWRSRLGRRGHMLVSGGAG